ncbi:Candidapepsin-9 [Spathaspora sp. JA1]|nr:Candidapepsin-9 [Spathaspora sp. JA1]
MHLLFILVTLLSITPISGKNVTPFKIDFNIRRGDSRSDISDSGPARLEKRQDPDGSLNMVILNQQTFYLANLSIGSNQDSVGVLIDTGSSDLWVMSHDVYCRASSNTKRDKPNHFGSGTGVVQKRNVILPPPTKSSNVQGKANAFTTTLQPDGFQTPSIGGGSGGGGGGSNTCTELGSFNTERSDTFVQNNTGPFRIQYADGSAAVGIWGSDNVFIGETKVQSLSFAIANQSSSDVGVLGIGLPGLETTTEFGYMYENLPIKLRNQGTINKALFSIYLGKASDSQGSILFGAIDHAKFVGNLQTFQMQQTYAEINMPVRIQIALDSIDIQSGSNSQNLLSSSSGVVLDTGSTLSYVTPDVLQSLGQALGGSYSSRSQAYIVDCNQPQSATLNLKFGSQTIKVPVTDLLIQATSSQCYLGILAQSSSSSYLVLGDNILRNAYVVVNLDDYQVSLAPVNFTDEEDIEVISSSVPTSGATSTTKSTTSSTTKSTTSTKNTTSNTAKNTTGTTSSATTGSTTKSTTSIPISGTKVSPIKMDFNIRRGDSRTDLSGSGQAKLEKRQDPDGSLNMVILNQQTFYLANLSIGSNKESVGVLLDTGSSDLFVMSPDVACSTTSNTKRDAKNKVNHFDSGTGVANIYKEEREALFPPPTKSNSIQGKSDSFTTLILRDEAFQTQIIGSGQGDSGGSNTCTALGSFNTERSDTFVLNNTNPFQTQFADGSAAIGIWGHDNVFIGNTEVANLSFAIANQSSSDVGVLGIGLPGLETTTQFGFTYENLPVKLRNQGTINRALYSIYLGKASDSQGSILFGAIDHAKFVGDLQTHSMQANSQVGVPNRIQIGINSIDIQNDSKSRSILSSSSEVVLDTGSTLSSVSSEVLQNLGEALGGTFDSESQVYIVDCNQPKSATLNLQFGNQTIKVPVSDLVFQATASQCFLGVLLQSSQAPFMIFGDNILRSAYVVVDFDDFEVSLAPVNFTDDEDIEVITSSVPTTGATSTTGSTGSTSISSGSSSSSSSSIIGNERESGASYTEINPFYAIGLISFIVFALFSISFTSGKNVTPFKIDFSIRRGDSRADLSDSGPARIVKREDPDGSFNMVILNQQTFYLADLSIGSNNDSVGVLIDTGSSDLWVMSHDVRCMYSSKRKRDAKNKVDHFGLGTGVDIFNENQELDVPPPTKSSDIHKKPVIFSTTITLEPDGFQTPTIGGGSGGASGGSSNTCAELGSFNTERSDTFVQNRTIPFQIQYADGSAAVGIWGYDNVFIGNTEVANLSFAIANQSSSDVGVLGIGLPGLETTTQFGFTYENLPVKLRNQGTINRALYSIYLGKASDKQGSILFGAIDHAKYVGNLQTLPMQRSYAEIKVPVRVQVGIDSIDIQSRTSSRNLLSRPGGVVLDTGSTLSYVTSDVLQSLARALGGIWSQKAQAYVVNCNIPKSVTLNLKFGNQIIKVPVTDLLIQANTRQCYLGILAQTSTSPYMLFGDNILRSAYIVVDLDGFQVSIAPVNFTDKEDIEVITSSVPTTGATNNSTGSNLSAGSEKKSGGSHTSVNTFCVIGLSLLISLTMFI